MAEFFDLPPRTPEEEKSGTVGYAVVEWAEECLKRGQQFVESSVGYDRISESLDAIFTNEKKSSGVYAPAASTRLSKTRVNLMAKTAEDLTALLTDTRLFWNYSTHNPRYESQARLCNKEAEDWYTDNLIDLRLADMIRYYSIAGTAYAHLYYSRRLNDSMMEAEDPRHVYPIDPISYHTLQDAKGVIVRKARTPFYIKSEYGIDVAPDIGAPGIFGWFTRTLGSVGAKKTGPLSKKKNDDDGIPHTPTVFENIMYLDDQRVNKTSQTLYMGNWKDENTPLSTWSYKVKPGQPIYPFKRLIVWAGRKLLYDNTSPYIHGMFPVIKLTLNPWPKAWLGKAPLWDVSPLNDSMNRLLRVVDDHADQVAQPGATADRNVSKAEFDRFNSRAAGYKIRTNSASGKGIAINQPPPLDPGIWPHINWLETMIQKLSGTADMNQISQLNQIPSGDTIDTIMKAMTPGVRLRSRIIEGFMKEFAKVLLYNITQFDTMTKRVAKFGPSAVTKEDFDFDPGKFVPDDIPDGEPGDIASEEQALAQGPRPYYLRVQAMLRSFSFNFKPGSLLNSAAQQDRMEDLMLAKMGYLSYFTLMENLGKMNVFPPTLQIPNDELSRLALQQQLGIGMVANAQGRKATDAAPPSLGTDGSGDVTLKTS